MAFYFAAVGAAVGCGNVWRFPSLVYEYGGGAFFVPYLSALAFVGLPVLLLELALGQYYETGGEREERSCVNRAFLSVDVLC